jgi:SAM-dependent methyltransferase
MTQQTNGEGEEVVPRNAASHPGPDSETKRVKDNSLGREQLKVVLAEYAALRAELMFFMNSIQVSHQFTWTLVLAEIGTLVYMDKLDHWLLFLAYLFGAPSLILLLLLRSAANRANLLVVADYIHKGIKRQIEDIIHSQRSYALEIGIFEWEEHKARSHRVQRRLLKILDISPWGVFYVAFVVSFILGLYLGINNQFFGWNPIRLIVPGSFLCLLGIMLTSIFAAKYNVIDSEARYSRGVNVTQEANRFRYAARTLDTAKSIILTPEAETSTDERWANETIGTIELITKNISAGGCVLDFGMGIGRILRALSEKRSDIRLIGVDSSPEMRRLAHKYLGSSRSYDIHEDMSKVQFESVDFAYALYVLQHISSHLLDSVIEDIYKSLKPGGMLFIINNKRRVVPVEVEVERSARHEGLSFIDLAISKVARDEQGHEQAWKDDGISVMERLKNKFRAEPQIIEPNPKWFCAAIRANHDFAIFRK